MEWRPPTTKTEYVGLLRRHTIAFTQFGYRPKEIRLSPLGLDLYTSGTKRLDIKAANGVVVPVNCDWNFVESADWDLVEYLAAPPPSPGARLTDRRQRVTTYLVPQGLDWFEAVLYGHLRLWGRRRFSIDDSLYLVYRLGKPLGAEDPVEIGKVLLSTSTPNLTTDEVVALMIATHA